jgi:hypothetical protein
LVAGWTLLVQIKPLVLLHLLIGLVCAAFGVWFAPGPLSGALLTLGVALVFLYALYAGLAVATLGLTRHRLGLLLRLPLVVSNMITIFVGGVLCRDAWLPARRNPNVVRC